MKNILHVHVQYIVHVIESSLTLMKFVEVLMNVYLYSFNC